MGMLENGKWIDDEQRRNDAKGAFVRPDSAFRGAITRDGASGFAAERGRYHLFVAHSCPWAQRTVIVRRLKKLEDLISLSYAGGQRTQGWAYSQGIDELQPEGGVLPLHRVYTASSPNYTGRVTVPVLWDRKRRTIVNNESSEIIRMLNSEFGQWAGDSPDLYPPALRSSVDEINAYVYERVNNGVYRCGFAKSQPAYEEAFARLFEALDALEQRLAAQRFLAGGQLSEADVRLFTTLVRFDAVYHYLFKCNLRRLEDYPNLSQYLRDLYQRRGFGDTVDIERIKREYYSNARVNPTGIVPLGPILDFSRAHDRGRFAHSLAVPGAS
jgi:glutathionyl-hydroquinone reductase